MIKEITSAPGCWPSFSEEDTVIITDFGHGRVIDLALANCYHQRRKFAAIDIGGGFGIASYIIEFTSCPREEFLDIVAERYPDFFVWLLFHPELYT